MHFILFYDYVENIVERRALFREAHLTHVRDYVERDELVLGGAFASPADGAAIVFKLDSAAQIEEFVLNLIVCRKRFAGDDSARGAFLRLFGEAAA